MLRLQAPSRSARAAKISVLSPAPPQGRDAWYAQYRQVSANGVLWCMINNANKQPICYVGATEALDAAKLARDSGGTACR